VPYSIFVVHPSLLPSATGEATHYAEGRKQMRERKYGRERRWLLTKNTLENNTIRPTLIAFQIPKIRWPAHAKYKCCNVVVLNKENQCKPSNNNHKYGSKTHQIIGRRGSISPNHEMKQHQKHGKEYNLTHSLLYVRERRKLRWLRLHQMEGQTLTFHPHEGLLQRLGLQHGVLHQSVPQ